MKKQSLAFALVFIGIISLGILTAPVARAQSSGCGSSLICRNLPFANASGKTLKADIYLPTNKPTASTPAIIFFFPGSWAGGSKNDCMDGSNPQGFINNFRAEGYAFVCVDYRLTNVASFPAQIYDAKAAVRWLRANAAKYNIDSNKIGALGWSAGGHLALMLGASAGEPAFEGDLGNANQSSAVQAVISLSGPGYFVPPVKSWTDGSQNDAIFAYLGGNPEKSQTALVNAILATVAGHVNGNEPPFLLQYGNLDTLVPPIHGSSIDNALRGKGMTSLYKLYNGGHGSFDWYPDQIAFLNKYLKGNSAVPKADSTPVAPTAPVAPTIVTPPSPTNLTLKCNFNGTKATLTWRAPKGYNNFNWRANPVPPGGPSLPITFGENNFAGTSKSFTATPGKTYIAWVHTYVNGVESAPVVSKQVTCPGSTPVSTVSTTTVSNSTTVSTVTAPAPTQSPATSGGPKLCVFDPIKYANYYSDLKAAFGYDATKLKRHWLISGIDEGRTPCGSDMPSCKFVASTYVNLYSDLVAAQVNGRSHYMIAGINEGRGICPIPNTTASATSSYASTLVGWDSVLKLIRVLK